MIERWHWVSYSTEGGQTWDWLLRSVSGAPAKTIALDFAAGNEHIMGKVMYTRVVATIPTWWLAERVFRTANWLWMRTDGYPRRYSLPGLVME